MNQRWYKRMAMYRPEGEPFDPSRYTVAPVPFKEARAFVQTHHYSGSYPADRCRVGLYDGASLVGVAVFSVPMNQRVIPRWTGQAPQDGVELGRFVLIDEVPGNGESWFLARAFRLLCEQIPEVKAVMSCSDPVPRRTEGGDLVMPGHVGCIYQAHNGRFVGRTSRKTLILDPAGRVMSARALSKIRNGERGSAYSYEMLTGMGAPKRKALESGRDYVKRALAEGPFTRIRHPGNLVYVWPLGAKRQRRATVRGVSAPLPDGKKGDK